VISSLRRSVLASGDLEKEMILDVEVLEQRININGTMRRNRDD